MTHVGGEFGSGEEWFLATGAFRDPDTGAPVLTVTCKSFRNDATVVADGVAQPGMLAYLVSLFERFGLSYEVGHCVRGRHGVGARFEFPATPETGSALRALCAHMRANADECRPRALVGFDRIYDVRIRVPHDRCGILVAPTAYLAERNINVQSLRAETDPLGEVLGLPEVIVDARLDVPYIEVAVLEEELLRTCPEGSRVCVSEVWRLPDGAERGEQAWCVGDRPNASVTLQVDERRPS